jgi:hypothetical protein
MLHRPAPGTDAPQVDIAEVPGEARRAGSSFDARYGKLIRTAGIGTVPFALFYYQAELGLQPQEVWFITYVLAHRWTSDLPFPSLAGMARHSGLTKRALRNYKDSLVAKGFLIVHERRRADGGTTSHGYDFSPLFDRLDALIMRDLHVWGQRSPQLLSAARHSTQAMLPDPEAHRLAPLGAQVSPGGRGTHVPLPGKRTLSGRKRAASPPPGYVPTPRIESDSAEQDPVEQDPVEDPVQDRTEDLLEPYAAAQERAERAIPEDSGERHGNSPAYHPCGDVPARGRRAALASGDVATPGAAPTQAVEAASEPKRSGSGARGEGSAEEQPGGGSPAVAAAGEAQAVPADALTGSSSALEQVIDELTQHFDDAPEHRAANRTRARRLWRESGLAEPEFLLLVREAERRTLECAPRIRKRSTVIHNAANKMPYFFAVLSNLVRAAASSAPHTVVSQPGGVQPAGPRPGWVQEGGPSAVVQDGASHLVGAQAGQRQHEPDAIQRIWAAACEVLRARVSPASYRAFFEPAQPVGMEGGALVLAAADLFASEMLRQRFSEVLESAVSEALGQPCRVVVLFPGEPALLDGAATREHTAEKRIASVDAR